MSSLSYLEQEKKYYKERNKSLTFFFSDIKSLLFLPGEACCIDLSYLSKMDCFLILKGRLDFLDFL